MSIFAVALLCVQACLVQNIYSLCYGPSLVAPAVNPMGVVGPIAAPYSPLGYNAGCGASYGGSGVGNLRVAGELPVAGSTLVAGHLPIVGAVEFCGPAAAAGAVSITGACGCGCGGAYGY